MASSNLKRPVESNTIIGEEGGQPHSKRHAPAKANLQNHEINGSPGYLDDREAVREEMEQFSANLTKRIESYLENLSKEIFQQINSLKNEIREHVCKGMDHPNPHSVELVERTLQNSSQTKDTRNLELRIKPTLPLLLYTEMQLKGQQGCPLKVELVDANTDQIVTSGPESCAKLDVVALKGDFNQDEKDSWSVAEFEEYIVKEREGKRPLLTGKLQVKLTKGIGEFENLRFTDNSSWNSCKKFRIGVKVASGFCEGIRVREAITEAFLVREYRGKGQEKHDEPASDDEIWRLKKIRKDGQYCKRLNEEGIYKVEEFVRHLFGDSKKLRNILGRGIPDKKWNDLIDHAKKCVPDGKSYVYYDDKKHCGVVINNICQLESFIADGERLSTDQLSDSQKAQANDLVKAASKNWNHVKESNAEALASFSTPVQSKGLSACPDGLSLSQKPFDVPSDRCLTALSFPIIQSSEASQGISASASASASEYSTAGFGNVDDDHSFCTIPQSLEKDANPGSLLDAFGNTSGLDPLSEEDFDDVLSALLSPT